MPATVQGIRLLSRKDLFSNRLFDLSLLVTSSWESKVRFLCCQRGFRNALSDSLRSKLPLTKPDEMGREKNTALKQHKLHENGPNVN